MTLNKLTLTHLWEDDRVRHLTQLTSDWLLAHSQSSVQPVLQAGQVHPLSASSAPAGTQPLSTRVILLCGKTHPAVPEMRHEWTSASSSLMKQLKGVKTHKASLQLHDLYTRRQYSPWITQSHHTHERVQPENEPSSRTKIKLEKVKILQKCLHNNSRKTKCIKI